MLIIAFNLLICCQIFDKTLKRDESEEGLEALNKQIRRMREHGSRKNSKSNNFQDTFHHIWDRSRPTIVEMERKIIKKKPKIVISTEIEALVESLFLEE